MSVKPADYLSQLSAYTKDLESFRKDTNKATQFFKDFSAFYFTKADSTARSLSRTILNRHFDELHEFFPEDMKVTTGNMTVIAKGLCLAVRSPVFDSTRHTTDSDYFVVNLNDIKMEDLAKFVRLLESNEEFPKDFEHYKKSLHMHNSPRLSPRLSPRGSPDPDFGEATVVKRRSSKTLTPIPEKSTEKEENNTPSSSRKGSLSHSNMMSLHQSPLRTSTTENSDSSDSMDKSPPRAQTDPSKIKRRNTLPPNASPPSVSDSDRALKKESHD